MWLARDKDGDLGSYEFKPARFEDYFATPEGCIEEGILGYPEVTWENSPVEV